MKESVLDILIYLFENYFDADLELRPRTRPRHAQGRAGTSRILRTRSRPRAGMARAAVRGPAARRRHSSRSRAIRVFDAREQARLDTDCRGYILYLENIGIVNAAQRELVIDRLLALDARQIDIEQVKWVVLMVLFSQPGQESAYLRMEDLVFDNRAGSGALNDAAVNAAPISAAPRPPRFLFLWSRRISSSWNRPPRRRPSRSISARISRCWLPMVTCATWCRRKARSIRSASSRCATRSSRRTRSTCRRSPAR